MRRRNCAPTERDDIQRECFFDLFKRVSLTMTLRSIDPLATAPGSDFIAANTRGKPVGLRQHLREFDTLSRAAAR